MDQCDKSEIDSKMNVKTNKLKVTIEPCASVAIGVLLLRMKAYCTVRGRTRLDRGQRNSCMKLIGRVTTLRATRSWSDARNVSLKCSMAMSSKRIRHFLLLLVVCLSPISQENTTPVS